MKKIILLYGLLLFVLLIVLKTMEYKFMLREISTPIYLSLVAIVFIFLGIWLGIKLAKGNGQSDQLQVNVDAIAALGLRPRELEILHALDSGQSNQQIADQLFISINTVKTHLKNIYHKLEVTRRTQALQKARALNIII